MDFDNAPFYLLVAESAELARVGRQTIRRWLALGHIQASKPAGGRVLIHRDALRSFIERGRM